MAIVSFSAKNESAKTRSQCYAFLSYVHVPLPGSDFMQRITDDSIYRIFRSSTGDEPASPDGKKNLDQGLVMVEDFLSQVEDTTEDDLVQNLAVERARLFRGIKRDYGPPPPYGSVYIEGDTVMNKSTLQVRKIYADFGYRLGEDCKELPDYISVELDFMRHLCSAEAEAWKGGDERGAQACSNGQREFLQGHLLQWVPRFCDAVVRYANQAFYQGMAQVTKGFLMIDAKRPAPGEEGESKNE